MYCLWILLAMLQLLNNNMFIVLCTTAVYWGCDFQLGIVQESKLSRTTDGTEEFPLDVE